MMSTHPENIKGGVSIIWKIENYRSIETFWHTYCTIQWPDTKSEWIFMIAIRFNEDKENKKEVVIMFEKLDKIKPLILSGTISCVSGKFCFPLNQFAQFNFEEIEDKQYITVTDLETFEYTDSEKQDFINDSVTIHFNLWDPNINDLVGAEYFIHSTYCQQTRIFQWVLDRNTDWKKKGDCTESTIEIPIAFKDYISNRKELIINFNLHVKDRETFTSIFVDDYKNRLYPVKSIITYCYKLKIQRKDQSNPPLLESGWSEYYIYEVKEHLRKIIEEKWDYLSTEWIITIEFIFISYCRGVIEKFSYKPSIQNLKRNLSMSKRNSLLKNNLRECLYKSYKEREHCDIVLRANNETFPCHKAVLCSRSPVFKTMFENNMIENETNVVNINDVESPILEMFLNYLYLDNLICKDFDSALKLYEVADKYAVIKLQEECANIIVSSLSTENVCQVLDLADSHEDEDLKQNINLYICEHIKEIVNTSSWKQFLLNKPVLAAETLQVAITYKL